MTQIPEGRERPSPESFLTRIESEEQKARRGKLKIFFGSCAGVGKTYGMLSAAHEHKAQGLDVVIGVVETHQRPQTQALCKDLNSLAPLTITYRGVKLHELDLDAALERKPDIILIDELAHTNAPGCRHPKRWHDVVELLDAGISVFTTLNVQHIESLSDLVAGTTGVWVKETVPDSVFDMADDVVLVDIDSDDLLKRLHEGNVYIAPEAKTRAAENFFKKGNLNALREIALRRTAQRVDAESTTHDGLSDHLALSASLLVCVDATPLSAKLVRTTKRLAVALKAPWTAIHIETDDKYWEEQSEKRRFIEDTERMVERLGGAMVTLRSENVIDEIIAYARDNHITHIIIGKNYSWTWQSFTKGYFVDQLLRRNKRADILVVSDHAEKEHNSASQGFSIGKPLYYGLSFVIVIAVTALGQSFPGMTPTDQAMLYLAGIVLVAIQMGFGPALFYALIAASTFSIFFSHLDPNEHAYLTTFAVMLITGYAIASQASKLRRQAINARETEYRTRSLYELTRKLSSTNGRFNVCEVVCGKLAQDYDLDATVWVVNAEGHLSVVLGNLPEDTYYKDFGALQWSLENAKSAGRSTATLPNSHGYYLPLISSSGVLGVIGLYPRPAERVFLHHELETIQTVTSLLATALERVHADEIAQQTLLQQENKKLHEAVSESLQQGVNAPLTALTHSMKDYMKGALALDPITIETITTSLDHETHKLGRAVEKIVHATHFDIGGVKPNQIPSSLPALVDRALIEIGPLAQRHTVIKSLPSDLPDILVDAAMIEQLFINVLENAFKYAPPSSKVSILAERQGPEIVVTVEDEGPGFPQGMENKVFDKYFSLPHAEHDRSAGLGLTISSGIVRLHNGRIWAENRTTGGARITMTLPIA